MTALLEDARHLVDIVEVDDGDPRHRVFLGPQKVHSLDRSLEILVQRSGAVCLPETGSIGVDPGKTKEF